MPAPLITLYEGWDRYNGLLQRAVSPLDQRQLSLQAADNLWSVRMLASHIVAVRAWWFNGWMGEGGNVLARFVDYDEGDESAKREAAAIVDALGRSWSCLEASLRTWNEDDLDKEFQRPEPNPHGERETRRWIVWHVVEHDLHHGGEMSLTLGMHGLTGIGI